MILCLDHKIFGNGRGMATPYFDGRFYWLVNTKDYDRRNGSGELYKFSHGLGAQLTSVQWTHPKAGERRRLIGRDFVAFNSVRKGIRVRVSWAMVRLPENIDEANAAIRRLEADLNSTLMEPR